VQEHRRITGRYVQSHDWGPVYRIYFGMDGSDLIVLLGGGGKKGQQNDIAIAQERWRDYRRRKAKE